jgi:hypothetical protein
MTSRERGKEIERVTESICNRFWHLDKGFYNLLSQDNQLKRMVETGWEVAAIFAQQRCRLSLVFPHNADSIEDEWVDVVEELENRSHFIFSVSPALFKLGNGYGQDFEDSLYIIKSKVVSGD